jgi:hypothetical protein
LLAHPRQVVSPRNGGEEAPCPFCAKPSYLVYFTGPKTEAERKADELEAERTEVQQRLMREARAAPTAAPVMRVVSRCR